MILRKIIIGIIVLALVLPGCIAETNNVSFASLNNPKLLDYIRDEVYAELVANLDGEDYIVDDITAVYISQEYLEELEFNSQVNIYFGYTLAEVQAQFKDEKYVFTLGDNNETVVEKWEAYDDTYQRVLRNVAIGTGVILVCVTVSVATAGVGLTTTSLVFAASAKTGTIAALSGGLFGGVSAGVIKGVQTGDINEAVIEAALKGSEAFKWGAITGAVTGGISEISKISRAASYVDDAVLYEKGTVEIPSDLQQWQQAELRALNEYGGYEQLTFLDGKQVPFGTSGGTRPDVIRLLGDHIEAVEVKYYNLESSASVNTLYKELYREVSSRVLNLPKGSTQRIVLDVTNRGFSMDTIQTVQNGITELLKDVYPNIPIDILGVI